MSILVANTDSFQKPGNRSYNVITTPTQIEFKVGTFTADGTNGQAVSFTGTNFTVNDYTLILYDVNGATGVEIVSQTVGGFTVNSLAAGTVNYQAFKK